MTITPPGRPDLLGRPFDHGAAPDWTATFQDVPRRRFLPSLIWAHDLATGASVPINRTENPGDWLRAAASNIPLVTQWDDGQGDGVAPGSVPTSSASMPSVVAGMLHDLDARPGMNVLEIGTGTGWNAALLARRLGDTYVTTIEVDAAVAASAQERLHAAGLWPTVIVGDGAEGVPGRSPFDRIIVTAGLRHVPSPLLRQLRPGGVLLAPWGTHFGHMDALVRLTARQDGSAAGGFLRPVEFMKVRAQRLAMPSHPEDFPGDATISTTAVHPPLGPWEPFVFAAGARLRAVTHVTDRRGPELAVWLYSLSDRSWAATVLRDGVAEATIYQSGPRRLWDELEGAYSWWLSAGSPEVDRFGLTVTPDGEQHVWLDDPSALVAG